jgi:hypothetical protein
MPQSNNGSPQNGRAPTHTPDPELVPRATRCRFAPLAGPVQFLSCRLHARLSRD